MQSLKEQLQSGAQPDHAEFPPSSLSNFEKCPGFRNRGDETEATIRGTRIHKALEHDKVESLPKEEQPTAQIMKDYIDAAIADRLPEMPTADFREQRLFMDLGGGISTFGTCDRLLIYGRFGMIFDYKTGYREIADAKENAQAWAYVLGAFEAYPELEEVEFTFLVPNRDEVFYHTFKRSDVADMRLRLNTIVRRAMELDWNHPEQINDSDLNPQPSLCEYCKFQTKCPALARKALVVSSRLGPGLPIPDSLVIDPKRPQDIAAMLRLVPLLETWAKGVRSGALKVNLEEGIDIPGYKRFERSTDRSVNSVLGAWEAVKDKIPLDDFLAACGSVSVVQLEDWFANAVKKGKGAAREDLNSRLRQADVLNEQGTIYYLKEQKK